MRRALHSLDSAASLEELNAVRTPRRLGTVLDERTACILAGSFVQFLIERYGLAQFQALYETENYVEVYGKSLAALEAEWRSSLGR